MRKSFILLLAFFLCVTGYAQKLTISGVVGNTLNGKGCDYRFDFIKYPDPKYRRAIKPVNEADAEKMMEILIRMREEDPTWVIEQSKELKQTIVSGQGEFHLRTLKWRIENNDKLPIEYLEAYFLGILIVCL